MLRETSEKVHKSLIIKIASTKNRIIGTNNY